MSLYSRVTADQLVNAMRTCLPQHEFDMILNSLFDWKSERIQKKQAEYEICSRIHLYNEDLATKVMKFLLFVDNLNFTRNYDFGICSQDVDVDDIMNMISEEL